MGYPPIVPGMLPLILFIKPLPYGIAHHQIIPGCTAHIAELVPQRQYLNLPGSRTEMHDRTGLALLPAAAFILALIHYQLCHPGTKCLLKFFPGNSCIFHNIMKQRCRNDFLIIRKGGHNHCRLHWMRDIRNHRALSESSLVGFICKCSCFSNHRFYSFCDSTIYIPYVPLPLMSGIIPIITYSSGILKGIVESLPFSKLNL